MAIWAENAAVLVSALIGFADLARKRQTLLEYTVHSVTEGIDALGRVSVRVRDQRGRVFHGAGADTDIIVASVQAYLRALNRITVTHRVEGSRDEAHAV